jgi:hypothetical protein
LAEIYLNRGSQFDASVVNAICRIMRWDPRSIQDQPPATAS